MGIAKAILFFFRGKMKSSYGDRETVGTTYLEAQKNSTAGLVIADLTDDMSKGFVDDLNDTFKSDPFNGQNFYVRVVEERDLLMKNAFKRRIFKLLYRPYPEDNTMVFYVEPKNEIVRFCWDIPHHSEFFNILSNQGLYPAEYVQHIKDWCNGKLENFGFMKVNISSGQVEGYDEKLINNYKQSYINYCESIQMDAKALETEKKLGFFWIPNKFTVYKDITDRKKAFKI